MTHDEANQIALVAARHLYGRAADYGLRARRARKQGAPNRRWEIARRHLYDEAQQTYAAAYCAAIDA